MFPHCQFGDRSITQWQERRWNDGKRGSVAPCFLNHERQTSESPQTDMGRLYSFACKRSRYSKATLLNIQTHTHKVQCRNFFEIQSHLRYLSLQTHCPSVLLSLSSNITFLTANASKQTNMEPIPHLIQQCVSSLARERKSVDHSGCRSVRACSQPAAPVLLRFLFLPSRVRGWNYFRSGSSSRKFQPNETTSASHGSANLQRHVFGIMTDTH